ncbi:flavin-containing monooxygenase [Aeromicrobium yanjiei]|uniref:SidA/IucD/PvdA family monooxygenase n=1 Tax=Aeromicrobium yanjiei TaxID=2662028 RepID=A0A5Q2MDD8_9ACTN|nr:NAD(P)/FAD-dependent oxidoreductase [Aeromicrobium yanjiei]QGG40588.1 SidA/IucD/PvdA family monooxygenase [Aeromicrobium yanjiei]
MTVQDSSNQAEVVAAQQQAAAWLDALSAALAASDRDALESLFVTDGGWRDLLAFTWNLRQVHDNKAIADLFLATAPEIAPRDFAVSSNWPAPVPTLGEDGALVAIETFFSFSVVAGSAEGLVYLVPDPADASRLLGKTLLTRLVELDDAKPVWPPEGRFDAQHPGVRWSEHRAKQADYADRDPEVLIVGGGQWGIQTAAHLGRVGVDALVIDKLPNAGDCWRTRYESLFLHQPHNMLHFSLMPFPESFPEYLPKDKVADFVESYVKHLDINFWGGTELLSGRHLEDAGVWEVELRQADGSVRTMRPKHVMLATGGSDVPNIPDFPGLSEFQGEVLHSSEFRDGRDYAGKKVLVVGTGTSAHDFALDVVENGGQATMVQRSPLMVVDLETANQMYGVYRDRSLETRLVDFRFLAGAVFHQQRAGFQEFQKFIDVQDKHLHDGLANAGMETWGGEDGTGFYYGYLSQSKGGYYLNVGASDAIIAGKIGVMKLDDLERFDANGIVRADGTTEQYDVVILATAYRSISEGIKKYFGEELAEKVGPVWGFGPDGEMRNVLKPTPQEGFWILEGSIPMSRWHSPLMALFVKAEQLGLIPESFKDGNHLSRTPKEPVPALAPYWSGR